MILDLRIQNTYHLSILDVFYEVARQKWKEEVLILSVMAVVKFRKEIDLGG